MSMEMEAKIEALGVVPVVVLQDAKDAVPLAKALCQGGLPCAEVTFRTAAAAESIGKMTQEFPEMLVGAGTVLTVKQVDEAVAAGAKFIVSPGFDPEIVDSCIPGMHHAFRGRSGSKERASGGEVLPGTAVWRRGCYQSACGSLCRA